MPENALASLFRVTTNVEELIRIVTHSILIESECSYPDAVPTAKLLNSNQLDNLVPELCKLRFTQACQQYELLETVKKNIVCEICKELIEETRKNVQQNREKYKQLARDYGISVLEVDVILRWTTPHHKAMQNYLWNPDNDTSDMVKLECIILQHALDKLEKLRGKTLYRLEPYKTGKYKEGKSFTNLGFTSTSERPLDPENLPGLSEEEDLTLIVVTKSKNGVDISPFACKRAKNQDEVLFPARTTFTVKRIEKGDELKELKKKLSPNIKRRVYVTEKENDSMAQVTSAIQTMNIMQDTGYLYNMYVTID